MAKRRPTPKQLRFILAYVACGNAAEAARRAGFTTKYSGDIGRQLLQKAHVREEVERRQGRITTKLEVTAEAVIGGLARVAFADAGELFDGNGRLRPIHSLPDNVRMAIAGVDVVQRVGKDGIEQTVTKIRLAPRTEALHLLGKVLRLPGLRPGVLDMTPREDGSARGQARLALADLLSEMESDALTQFREVVDRLKAAEQQRLAQTIDGQADEVNETDDSQDRD